jgi:hypothetical protein
MAMCVVELAAAMKLETAEVPRILPKSAAVCVAAQSIPQIAAAPS